MYNLTIHPVGVLEKTVVLHYEDKDFFKLVQKVKDLLFYGSSFLKDFSEQTFTVQYVSDVPF